MAKIILGFSGEMASGKGLAVKYIEEKYKASSYRFSTILRDILKVLCLEESRENIQKISTVLRKNFGEDLFSKIMKEQIKKDKNEFIAVDGIRRMEDIKYLKEIPEFKFVYLEADVEKRYERTVKRKENAGDENKTIEKFKKDHAAEAETQIKDLKQYADFILENNGTEEELFRQVDNIINEKK
ncbi:MAG: AAA family ATPase [Candidatus Moranbacteria bacterium]|nr:AAA family ATPase [Candidatus Moranbacteria bacterium]